MVCGEGETQVTSALEKLKSTTEKLKALKCQLEFSKELRCIKDWVQAKDRD